MPSARSTFFELSALTTLVVLLAWAPLFVEIAVDRSCAEDEIPAPALLEMKHKVTDGPWLVVPGIAALLLLGAFRALPRLRDRKASHKVLVLGGAAATQAVVVMMLGLLSLTLDPHWLFGIGVPTMKQPSPNGARTAWAMHSCFFTCDWRVWVQEQGAWKMKRVSLAPAGKEQTQATLEWSADSKDVKLVVAP